MLLCSAQAVWRPCLDSCLYYRLIFCEMYQLWPLWEKSALFRTLAETPWKASSIKKWHIMEISWSDTGHYCYCPLLMCLMVGGDSWKDIIPLSGWGISVCPYKGLASAAASLMCSCLTLHAITWWNSWGSDSMVPICVPESGSFWLIIQFSLYTVGNNSILALEKGIGLDWNIGLHNFFSSLTTNSYESYCTSSEDTYSWLLGFQSH